MFFFIFKNSLKCFIHSDYECLSSYNGSIKFYATTFWFTSFSWFIFSTFYLLTFPPRYILPLGIKTTSDDTIPGMTSAPLAPLGDTIPPMPSGSHEQGVVGPGNSYRHLFPNYPPLQSTSDDRNKVEMKCIKGEYERTRAPRGTSHAEP
jgi:hypothetical protein